MDLKIPGKAILPHIVGTDSEVPIVGMGHHQGILNIKENVHPKLRVAENMLKGYRYQLGAVGWDVLFTL